MALLFVWLLISLSSLIAIARSFEDAGGRLDACQTLISRIKFASDEDQAEAETWSGEQLDMFLAEKNHVKRKDAASLVAVACRRQNAAWLLEKYHVVAARGWSVR